MTKRPPTENKRSLIGTHKRDPSKYKIEPPRKGMCNAYSRKSGKRCTSTRLYPNGRCKLHGGIEDKTSGENGRNVQPPQSGVYSKTNIYEVGLLKEEKGKVFEDIVKEVGTLDSELHMARIFLRRAYSAQRHMTEARDELKQYENDPDRWILIAAKHGYLKIDRYEVLENGRLKTTPEIRRELQDRAYRRVTRKINDYTPEIRKYTNIIKNLEAQRKELLDNQGDLREDFIRELAGSLRSFTDAVTTKMHNGASFCTGNYPNLKPRKHDSE